MAIKTEISDTGTKWLSFYVYVKLPLDILSAFYIYGMFGDKPIAIFAASMLAFFFTAVLIGMLRRYYWGWMLNWGAILLSPIPALVRSIRTGVRIEIFWTVLFAVVWVYANSIYFQKRKSLFLR
jgi:hypothetical protein